MGISNYLKRTTFIIGSLVILICVVLVVVLAIRISVNVAGIRAREEAAATQALGRKVSIDGHLAVDLSFRPAIEVDGLKIANPSSWNSEDFVKVNLSRARIRILPLLRSRIHIQEIKADGIDVNLELKADGRKNWLFDVSGEKSEGPPASTAFTCKHWTSQISLFPAESVTVG